MACQPARPALAPPSLSQYHFPVMRLLFMFLAVLGLLASPVTAAAAQASCGHHGPVASSGMEMPAMPGHAHMTSFVAKGDPCCDPSGKSHKTSHKNSARGCCAACADAMALPASLASGSPPPARAPLDIPVLTSTHGLEPAGLERPPKSIA
ncbi:MAG TPA: hypothetical protein VGH03_14150 [Caulobacteraceae bacterium]|jgi:hypothetical protein